MHTDLDAGWSADGALRHRTALTDNARIFGLGERATPNNRRGRTHILWNTDPAGYTNDDDPINLNIPVYIVTSVHKKPEQERNKKDPSGILPSSSTKTPTTPNSTSATPHPTSPTTASRVGNCATTSPQARPRTSSNATPNSPDGTHYRRCGCWATSNRAGPTTRRIASANWRRTSVTTTSPATPSTWTSTTWTATAASLWIKTHFPNLPQLAADLREQGIKLITIIDPAIKKDPQYAVYQDGLANGHFSTTPDGNVYHAPVWPGLSAFPDFTAPRTRAWWGKLYQSLVDAGVEGFWNDMNEPAAFAQPTSTTLPDVVHHSLEGRGGDHREAHNLYGMQMVRASYDGLLALQPDKRPALFTRSGWAGVQRYATSWTGDNESTWASLRLTVPMLLNLGLSGIGFTGPDIGGFAGEADGELFTRWAQMAAFMPFFRAHTIARTPDQEPWAYGEPYLSIVRRFIQLRYELLPYLYTAVWQMAERGWPMTRPLWWHHPSDDALIDCDDAFLCGDALLIAPVGEPGATSRPVTLPPGTWYNFWTNERLTRAIAQSVDTFAPLETIPLFVRAGTVLPMGEHGPSVEQRVQKFLRLSVYPLADAGESTSELYEDDGISFDYRQGDYRLNRFTLHQTNEKLTLTWTREGNYTPPYEHIELTLNGLTRAPRAVTADGESYAVLVTDPVRRTAVLGVPPFETLEVTL